METKFNFKSQICTTREQSERLLALGLKKETADCVLPKKDYLPPLVMPYDKASIYTTIEIIPAWSLGRLLELMRMKASAQVVPLDDTFDRLIEGIETRIKEGYFRSIWRNSYEGEEDSRLSGPQQAQ